MVPRHFAGYHITGETRHRAFRFISTMRSSVAIYSLTYGDPDMDQLAHCNVLAFHGQ